MSPLKKKTKYNIFGKKEIPSFQILQKRSCTGANFLESPSFQNTCRKHQISKHFFEKDRLPFCVERIRWYSREKEISSFKKERKNDTRKIIFQRDFFWKDHLSRTFGKRKYGFSCSVRALKSRLVIEEIPITPNSLTGLMVWIVIYTTVIRKLRKILILDTWSVWNKTGVLFVLSFLTYQIKIYGIKLVESSKTNFSWNFHQTVTRIWIPKMTCWCK